MKKLLFAVLKNEMPNDHQPWLDALGEREHLVNYEVIDLTKADWLKKVSSKPFDGLLAKPPAITNSFKTLYDERISILHEVLGIPIFPSLEEIRIYENKKYFSYWLAANQIPSPSTWVIYFKDEALNFIQKANYPLVGKTNIGASGRGVKILKNIDEASRYVQQVFSGKGTGQSIGPNWKKKNIIKRAINLLKNPEKLSANLKKYQMQGADVQKDYVIFQAFIPHDFEWRVVRIGNSFFAHKKLKVDDKASGSLIKNYDNPPLGLFDFVEKITSKHKFYSQAVDIFEPEEGKYLVNEMQCIFGQSDPYQMLVDGKMGRYSLVDNKWIFEEGDFNRHKSYLLRVDYFINLLSQKVATIKL